MYIGRNNEKFQTCFKQRSGKLYEIYDYKTGNYLISIRNIKSDDKNK